MDSRIRNLNYESAPTGTTQFVVDDASYTDAKRTTLLDVKEYVLDGIDANDVYTTGVTFDINTGILLNSRNDGGTFFTDLDGRYALSGETGGGTDGTSGVDGVAGTSGTSGIAGTDGTSGIDGSISGVTSDTDLTYISDVLSTPKLIISTATGAATVFQMYNTSGVLYDVTIVGSTLTATIA